MGDKLKKEKPKGHYEEKTVFIIPWGLIICMIAFGLGPFYMGTGLAFLMIPAQVSTLLLIPAYKPIKGKVFVKDKVQPITKISENKENLEKSNTKTNNQSKNNQKSFVKNLQDSRQIQATPKIK